MMGGAVTGNAIQQAQKDLAGGAAWQDLDNPCISPRITI